MGKSILGKVFSFAFAAALMVGVGQVQAQASSEPMKPLSINDVRVLFQETIELLKEKLDSAQNLTGEERIRITRDIEGEAEEARQALDDIINQSTLVGETTYIVGLLVTYQGELNLPTFWNSAKFGPGAETGLAVFLRQNQYFTDSLRGATAIIGSVTGEVSRNGLVPRRTGLEKGFNFKLLLATGEIGRPAASLADFEGFYTGVGTKVNVLGYRGIGPVYTKPQTCQYLNPLDCGVYIVALSGKRGLEPQPSAVELKEIYINFPHSNDKRGGHL